MVFHRKVEQIYRAKLFCRCDDIGVAHYFSHDDFEGLMCKQYDFKSSHGHTLCGKFYSYNDYNPARLIVFEHGFGGGHRSYMREIELLCRHGYRVFAYDHTGCMESGGESANGFAQSLCDLDDCLKTLKADVNVNTEDISVIGHSWGGFAALNIAVFHPDVKRVVALSGFVSLKKITEQNFYGILSGYRKYIYALEREANGHYADCEADKTLKNASTKVLALYSDNDKIVSAKANADALSEAARTNKDIRVITVSKKGHNPNYTEDAVAYLAEFADAVKKAKTLDTYEGREAFRNSFDWRRMTEQDMVLWNEIFEFLDN